MEGGMPRVKIYTKCLSEKEKESLLLLLREAGYEVVILEDDDEDVAIAPDQGEIDEDLAEEVLVVLLNPACEADPELKKAAARAVQTGSRVIGVWPEGATHGKVPAALEKHGSDVVTWNPTKLRDAIEEMSAQWETTAGAPRAEPYTKRNRC
jgi:hypothetical protein